MENTLYTDENIAKYFAGELEEKKIEKMEKNLMNDKEKEQEIKDFSRLWEKSAQIGTYDKINVDADWENVRKRMGFNTRVKKIPFTQYAIRVAAILVVAVGLAYLLNHFIKEDQAPVTNDYMHIAASEIPREITLPDNTVVTLNKNARLVYNNNYSKNNRDVILEGEAFFQVERNEALPFRVFVGNSTIEVLGTSFNIKPNEEALLVGVVKGHVAVYETVKKDNRIDLLQNEQVKLDTKSNIFEGVSPLNQNMLAWRTHRLEFKSEPLKNVFETVAEYFGKELVIKNNVNLTNKIDAEFPNQSIEEVISYLKLTIPADFDVEITSNEIIVSRQ